jgi:hypothetical protein
MTGGRVATRRRCVVRVGGVVATLIAIALLAAACGGGSSSPGVASVGSTTTTTSQAGSQNGNNASNSQNYADAVAYAQCMRSHGVPNFPDPNSQGNFTTKGGLTNGQDVGASSSQVAKANSACQHLLPNGGQPTAAQQQQTLNQLLKYSQCMRSHGEPNFPDPKVSANSVGFSLGPSSGISPQSPQFQAAQKACQSFLPGGGRALSGGAKKS